MIPVRLSEIPLQIRLGAVAAACRDEPDEGQRAAILAAALHPSDILYFVSFEKAPLVEELCERQAA